MSHTIFYLARPDFTRAANALVKVLVRNETAFAQFVGRCWSTPVPYTYAAFLKDFHNQRAAGWEVYYLAYPLLSEPLDEVGACEKAYLDIELIQLLQGDSVPFDEYRDQDEVDLPAPVLCFLQAGPFDARGTELQAKRSLAERGLRGMAVHQALLLNKLGNRRNLQLRPNPRETTFPIWIAAGWGNYEGHLGYADIEKLDPDKPTSFFTLFRRAILAVAPDQRYALDAIDKLLAMRDRVLSLGRGTTCIAISSK